MKITKKQIVIILFTLAMITVNALAVLLPLNNVTTKEISDSFKIYFAPAGYVFSIWSVIYSLLLLFSLGYTAVVKESDSYVEKRVFPYYLISAFLNAIWIVLWHYGFYLTTLTVMVSLLVTLINIYLILLENKPKSWKEGVVIHAGFSIYLGWISVATIANAADVLWLLKWNGFGLSEPMWAAIMMVVAGVIGLIMTFQKKDKYFALVLIWAFAGILVSFNREIIINYTGIGVISVLSLAWIWERVRELKQWKTKT